MGRDIASFVITVDCQIWSHKFSEHFIFVSNHFSEIVGPIFVSINRARSSAISVQVVVDGGSDDWQLGHQVHGVLEGGLPVLAPQWGYLRSQGARTNLQEGVPCLLELWEEV